MRKLSALFFMFSTLSTVILFARSTERYVHAQTVANVSVTPANQTVTMGSQATITIDVANVQNLGSFDVTLTFNPNILQIPTGGVVVDTTFLASTGKTVTAVNPIIDNASGTVSFGAYSLGSSTGPNGNGRLATITFDTTNTTGLSNLALTYMYLTYPNGTENPSTTVDGSVSVSSLLNPTPTPNATPSPGTTPDPTASPVPSSTPTSTPPTGTGTVILQIRFQGVVRMPSAGQDDRFVHVVVKQGETTVTSQNVRMRRTQGTIGSNTIVYYTNVDSDPNKLVNISLGTYDFYVSGPVHLTKKFTAEVIDANSNTLNFTNMRLLAGDIRDNNVVDEADYNRLVENFGCVTGQNPPPGKTCPSAGAPFPGDVDFDGEVGVFDFTYLIGNYSLQGQ